MRVCLTARRRFDERISRGTIAVPTMARSIFALIEIIRLDTRSRDYTRRTRRARLVRPRIRIDRRIVRD